MHSHLLPLLLICWLSLARGLVVPAALNTRQPTTAAARRGGSSIACKADLEEVTEKYGLEAGLFSALKNGGGGGDGNEEGEEEEKKGGMATAGDLLKRYGGAYLLTSTSLAVVSFSLCYFAISNGVDVSALLEKVGLEVSSTSETAGTVGLAYAVHKAASPIRFPPTVALTPIVAKNVFGKTDDDGEED